MARCLPSLPPGALTATPRLVRPCPSKVTDHDGDGFAEEKSVHYLRCCYMDLGDLPELRRYFASGLHVYGPDDLPAYWQRRRSELEDKARSAPVGKVGIPVWVEWCGTRARHSFEGRKVHDYRDITLEVHDPKEVYGDRWFATGTYYSAIDRPFVTYEALCAWSRPWLYSPEQKIPQTYFSGWPHELIHEILCYLETMAYLQPQEGWYVGERLLRQPPYESRPRPLMRIYTRRAEAHTKWLTTAVEVERYFRGGDYESAILGDDGYTSLVFSRHYKVQRLCDDGEDNLPVAEMVEYTGV